MDNIETYVQSVRDYLGEEGLRYFRHLKGLTGELFPVLRLNADRKGVPVYPVWYRDGMKIRNFLMRTHPYILERIPYNEFEDNVKDIVNIAIGYEQV